MYSLKLLQFSLLESSPKRGYRKNGRVYSILVYSEDPTCTTCPCAQYLTSDSETHTQENKFYTISNGSGPTSFGFCMKKL
jgi:hypothetical protein